MRGILNLSKVKPIEHPSRNHPGQHIHIPNMVPRLLLIFLSAITASATPLLPRDACAPTSRWNITEFELIQQLTDPVESAAQGQTHGRDIAFIATSLQEPGHVFECSARKFTIGSYEPPPQWDQWRASCYDPDGARMEIKFNMGLIPPGRGVPRHTDEKARLGLRVVGAEGEV